MLPVVTRERSAAPGAREANSCPRCLLPREGERCDNCGVAFEPNGHRITNVLAERPNARVYLARGPDARKVVVKEVLLATVPDVRFLEAFEREGEILRQLAHPRIPRFISTFREGEGAATRLYLVQEHVDGESLLQRLEHHRFSEEEALEIARSVLETLTYLHGLSPRVLHRDIKPANLIVRSDGSISLVDFGAARDLAGERTHGATLTGTIGYMPPEQFGGNLDPTCDLYALGATLIHLLARKPPWELLRSDMSLDFEQHLHVSPGTLRFLQRLVEREPSKRFRSANDALEALDPMTVPHITSNLPPLRSTIVEIRSADDATLSPPSRGFASIVAFPLIGAATIGLTPVLGHWAILGFPVAWFGFAWAVRDRWSYIERYGGGFLVAAVSAIAGGVVAKIVDLFR